MMEHMQRNHKRRHYLMRMRKFSHCHHNNFPLLVCLNCHFVMRNINAKSITNYAKTARPLNALKMKNKVFVWTQDCESAFLKLKRLMVSLPILKLLEMGKSFKIWTTQVIVPLVPVCTKTGTKMGVLRPVV